MGPVLAQVLPGRTDPLLSFQPDAALQSRIEELATKSTEGQLTEEASAEYAGYVRANKFLAVLRRQAQRFGESADG